MEINSIDDATELIKQGKQAEAQDLLKRLLLANHHNLPAWVCYGKTCSTDDERISLLRNCLKYNPDSKEAAQALSKLLSLRNYSQAAQTVQDQKLHQHRKAISSVLSLVIYGILLAVLAWEIIFFINTFFPPNGPGLGFAWFMVVPLGVLFFGAQAIVFTTLASVYIILVKRQTSITVAILGTGALSAIALIIYLVLRLVGITGQMESLPGEAIQILLVAFIFGFSLVFTSGAGFATLLIMIGDVVVNIAQLLFE